MKWDSEIVVNTFDFTEVQIDLLMENSVSGVEYYEIYKDNNKWFDSTHYSIVEVDKSREEEFFRILGMHQDNQIRCLSYAGLQDALSKVKFKACCL